ncbi:TonB-dependent receptor plug domain-containing protein [Dyella sedimenti]|uniref:TonB-dependent receptor plug domain-containing protein n=1 Tax=Dyella sedimenti TaxID=2919947 RepID=UPI001FA9A549|nr:TonB-dependent receptor [Dyella sedimenti]
MKPTFAGACTLSLLALSITRAFAGGVDAAPVDPPAQTQAASSQDTHADDSDAAKQEKAKKLEVMQVTGSLIPRAQIEGPSPVTTITAKDIDRQGFADTFEALRALPIANGSVQDPQFTGGYTPGAKTISLFGLSPSFTLTLLNGRPMASYPLAYNGNNNITDIANIPVGLIDHIDVLTGGQSSIYGSAAIAGVVNIVLKDHIEGTHVSLRYGDYSDGGGASKRLQVSSGHQWGDFELSGGIQLSKENPIWAYQRSYIDSYDDDPTGKGAVNSRTFLRMAAGDNAHYIDPGAATCAPLSYLYHGSTSYSYRAGSSLGYYCGSPENVSFATLANQSTDANGSLFARYHINDSTELYADMLYSFSNPTYVGGSPFWNQTFYNQASGQYEEWQRIFAPEEVGADATDQHVFTRSYNVSLGVRGSIGSSSWDYDAYYNRSQSNVVRKSTDFLANNGIDNYYLGPQLGTDANGYPIYAPNLDRLYQPLTQAQYNQFTATNRASSMSWTQNETITTNTTSLFTLPAGDVGFAAIVQNSNERFDNRSASPLADEGYFRGVTGSTAAAGKRSQYAFGGEMRVPLLETLTANVSGRYDKYSYAGGGNGKATYKLGLEYRPIDTLLLRGSYATAFRAPDMFYLFSSRSSGYSQSTDYYKCRQQGYNSQTYDNCAQAGTSMLAVSSGNTGLKDITAKSFTYGFVWSTPDNNLSWSVDYNAIRISNEVVTLGNDEILEQEADCRLGTSENGQTAYDINSPTCREVLGEVKRLPSTDPVNPGGVQEVDTYPINVASEYQTGIQSTLNYHLTTASLGSFQFGLDYYDELKHTYQEKTGDPTINYLCCANSDEFKSRVSGTVTWNIGKWSSTLFGIRNGRTWNAIGTEKNIGPWITFNGSVNYKVTPMTSISLVVNNIANKRPPKDITNGNWPYYDEGDYNALGRALYLEVGFDFGK